MHIIIKNGRVLNPASSTDEILDILTTNGKVALIEKNIDESKYPNYQLIDATGCFVTPGLIDLHVHLRDPGLTYKEDMESGSKAAAKGGFTTIVAMANTAPVVDNVDRFQSVQTLAKEKSPIQVIQVASLTKEMKGEELVPIKELKEAGILALSEDGKTVMNAQLFRQGLIEAQEHDLVVLGHCEDENMKGAGVYNQGEASDRLHLPGISNSVEDVIVARDIVIAKEVGAKLHICHCSTKGSVELVRIAKEKEDDMIIKEDNGRITINNFYIPTQKNVNITAEVCPHHFILTDKDIKADDSNYKMAPPLRSEEDRLALIQGLQDGTIDVIASDHAPHTEEEKGCDVARAAFGIVGLETMVPLTYTHLVKTGFLSPLEMVAKMSYNPAKILGIHKGDLQVGRDADITIIDPAKEYSIDKETFVSKGRNTPFHGYHVWGKVRATIYQGKIVHKNSNTS
jgi:dihydroorotase